ncbi:GDYXXLXY domain-containing protein [Oryzobacter telluris]|uniref:GDYXXLXY domain-containing protein n=1 Tax=Oryzobacter telluris TaxID=3149179 RepID=UPI00370D02E8
MSTPTTTEPTPPPPPPAAPVAGTDPVRSRRLLVIGAVAVQLLLVLVAVWSPLAARVTGEEVRLEVAPVDPMDPFRGAYVDLTYPDLPGQPVVNRELTDAEITAAEQARGEAWVPLTRQGDLWVGGPVQRTRPAEGLYLRCDDSDWRLECGIESWFLPQDRALALEDAVRAGTAVATIKVDGRGNAALVAVDPGTR